MRKSEGIWSRGPHACSEFLWMHGLFGSRVCLPSTFRRTQNGLRHGPLQRVTSRSSNIQVKYVIHTNT
eukprot:12881439-Prorocentrum_lima.AAC.1